MAIIHLIRHGQAQFGLDDYDALSPLGIEQSTLLGTVLKQRELAIDKVFCGSMKRHRQTMQYCLESYGYDLSDAIEHHGWNEFDHRDVIAKYDTRYADINVLKMDIATASNPRQKIIEVLTGAITRWTTGEENDYNEGWNTFCARIETSVEDIAAAASKKENILVFTSGGAISVVLKKVLGLSVEKAFELQLLTANASITRFKTSSRGLQLLSFNDHAHFEGPERRMLTFR